MPSDKTRFIIEDILSNVSFAQSLTAGITFEAFASNRTLLYAATRALEIISEASRRLPDTTKSRHMNVAWRDIADAGNVYRHGYDIVSTKRIWQTVTGDLVALDKAMRDELDTMN